MMLRSPAVYARPAEAQRADPRPACRNGLMARCPKMVTLRVSSPVLRSRGDHAVPVAEGGQRERPAD